MAEYGASWPTVIDPGESIKRAYRVVARPHTWFVDRAGVLRSLQIGGPMTDAEFERTTHASGEGGTPWLSRPSRSVG